jgi:hypothetical protein
MENATKKMMQTRTISPAFAPLLGQGTISVSCFINNMDISVTGITHKDIIADTPSSKFADVITKIMTAIGRVIKA